MLPYSTHTPSITNARFPLSLLRTVVLGGNIDNTYKSHHTENLCPLHNQKRTSLHKSGNPAPRRRARRCKQSRHSRRRRSVQVQRHHLESLLLAYDEAGMRASGFWGLLSPPGTCRRRQATRHHEVQNSTEESTPLEQSAPMNLTPRPIMTRARRDLKRRISFQVPQRSQRGIPVRKSRD